MSGDSVRRRGRRGAGPAALGAALLVMTVLAGCRTAPPAAPSVLSERLPEGAATYLYLDVPRAQEPSRLILSSAGVEDRQLGRILRRTERVAAAVGGESPSAFTLAASGRFRGFFLQAMLDEQDGWTRRSVEGEDRRYGIWTRDADQVEIAFPESRVVMLASGGLEERLRSSSVSRAPGAEQADEHAALAVIPRTEVSAPFGSMTVTVHDLEVHADPVDPVGSEDGPGGSGPEESGSGGSGPGGDREWRLGGALRLERESTARAFTALIRVLTVSMAGDTGADTERVAEKLSVEREGTRIFVEGVVLAERHVLEALEQFLLDRESEGT